MQTTVTNDNHGQLPLFPHLEGRIFSPEIYSGNGRDLLEAIRRGLESDSDFLERNGVLLLKEAKSALHKNLIALVIVDTITKDCSSLRNATELLVSLDSEGLSGLTGQTRSIVKFSRGIPALMLIARTFHNSIMGVIERPKTLH